MPQYQLCVDKLAMAGIQQDSGRPPIVLLLCGSFNPPTLMHLRMFDLASEELQRVSSAPPSACPLKMTPTCLLPNLPIAPHPLVPPPSPPHSRAPAC